MRNKLLVFEGIDGVGKSSICKLTQKELLKRGISATCYEEHENQNAGFNIIKPFIKREVPLNSSLYFYLASAIYKSKKIEGLLVDQWVLCDRYIYSTLAYHRIRGFDLSQLPSLDLLSILEPDFLFLVTVEESKRQERINSRPGNTSEDLRPKSAGSMVEQMEKALEAFNPIHINNSSESIHKAVDTVMSIIQGNKVTSWTD